MLSGCTRLPLIVMSAGSAAWASVAQPAASHAPPANAARRTGRRRAPRCRCIPILLIPRRARSVEPPLTWRHRIAALEGAREVRRVLEPVGERDLRRRHAVP